MCLRRLNNAAFPLARTVYQLARTVIFIVLPVVGSSSYKRFAKVNNCLTSKVNEKYFASVGMCPLKIISLFTFLHKFSFPKPFHLNSTAFLV